MADIVIHLPDVDEDGRDYEFALTQEWLGRVLSDAGLKPDPAVGAGALSFHIQRNGSELFLRGRLRAGLVAECGRCLGPAPVGVESELTALLVPSGSAARHAEAHEVELESDDLDRVPYDGSDVELDDLVREQLVLEIPMQPLCKEDCAGIEVPAHLRPPADDPVEEKGDPRLAPLRALRSRLPSGSD